MESCKPVSTLLTAGSKLTQQSDSEDSNLPFRELVGALMYIAQGTRQDVGHTASALSQFNSSYDKQHWQAAKRALRYLQGTSDYELVYRNDDLLL